jgi:hypothetical protein
MSFSLQNKLVHYEELLDLGQLFDHVPDFGLSLDLDCVNGWSMVGTCMNSLLIHSHIL